MINLNAIRNPAAESVGLSVQVSAVRCDAAGIALAFAGLRGKVTEVDESTGECLVRLDPASHERFLAIESRAFSKSYRDFDAQQWFCSGVLEAVQ